MAELIKCIPCQGRKIVLGLGNMSRKCDACKGIGYVEKLEPEPVKNTKGEKGNEKFTGSVLVDDPGFSGDTESLEETAKKLVKKIGKKIGKKKKVSAKVPA